ncbi:fatty acyl-AMP ligase [Chloroflexota bacterium]
MMLSTDLTVVEILQQRAKEIPDETAFIYLDQGEIETERVTFGGLDAQARGIAAYLQSVAKPGDRALLIYPTGLDFVRAMYGCLYAGVIPIPTNPPGRNRSVRRLQAIAMDAQADLGLTTPQFLQLLDLYKDQFPDLAGLNWIHHGNYDYSAGDSWQKPDLHPEKLAFIQYTSGSTNLPKGVMISYKNLAYNHASINSKRIREVGETGVLLTWTPLFHDMGLIVGVFHGVFDAQLSVLMNPITFIQSPIRWLKAIDKYKATFSGGPNFAYEICVNKITPDQCEGLDLSIWKTAFNSAEPVRIETVQAFSEKFAPYGFDSRAFHPAFGLAEGTLVVTGYGNQKEIITYLADKDQFEQGKIAPADPDDPQNCHKLVSCGSPFLEIQMAIVNPTTLQRCQPQEIGEIWVSGDNIAQGYWNRPDETDTTFGAMIADTGEGPFLRTGDLGFVHNGDLYVTGRFKDLIIVRGRNYYPQDVEFTVQNSHPVMRPGACAAFSFKKNGQEQLVVIQEVRQRELEGETWDDVIMTIRKDIAREHGIRAYCVVLIERGTISKTSSGKIMRSDSRDQFFNNQLDIVAEWRAPL